MQLLREYRIAEWNLEQALFYSKIYDQFAHDSDEEQSRKAQKIKREVFTVTGTLDCHKSIYEATVLFEQSKSAYGKEN